MNGARINLVFAGEPKNVSLAGAVTRIFCEFVRLPAPDAARVELALVEAANNAIIHGCHGRADAEIHMQVRIEGGALVIELRDPGIPLPVLPDGEMPDPLAESGRGWPLIRACVDRVGYRSEGGINILTLGKLLPAGSGG